MAEIRRPDLAGAEIFDVTPLMDAEGGDEGMESDLQALIKRSIEDAVLHFEENIEPDMALATDYYYGRPFGDEKAGRSQVVSTDVRDATLDQIPDLLEIYMGSDSVVEFKPRFEEDRAQAEQATDYVNYVFFEDNEGFLILNSIFKDAGVRRLAYTKWWWEEKDIVRGDTVHGLTEEELGVLAEDETVEFEIVGQDVQLIPQQDPQSGEMALAEVPTFDVAIERRETQGRARVEEVPPEEIVWTPEARKFSRAPLIAHRRHVTVDELIRMGIPMEFIEEHRGIEDRQHRATESLPWARQFYGSSSTSEKVRSAQGDFPNADPSQEEVMFTEAYALVESEIEEGRAEMRMFQCVGPDYEIWNGDGDGELVDEVPIAAFTPDPEPHTIPGLCNFDYLREIQRVKSQIQRGQLNSLAQSIEHQMVVAQNEVNIRDLISPEISGIIRVRRDVNNSVREIRHQFVGADTLPVLEYYDQIKADRTGNAGPREGLDPNILQSTTAEAVASTLSKSQKRIRMVARVYAETGFKYMFQGLLKLLVKHQDRERVIRLRNNYVPVDPRFWDANMDVSVKVALGTGSRTEKLQSLQALAAKQEEHLAQGSPLVSFTELRATYGKITDLMGYKDTTEFWRPWGQEQQQQFEQQQAEAAQNAPKPPEERIVDVEELKIQLDAQKVQRDHELKMLEVQLKDEREREKIAREFALKEYELELTHKSEIEDRALQEKVAANKQSTSQT